jgi:DNA-binding transcriptional LysR family regulator
MTVIWEVALKTPSRDHFSFRSIEVFIAVIEERSVTNAALRFGCSASTISNQLAKLESALGAKLIERSSQRFALTHAGELFALRARTILDGVMTAKADLSGQGHTPKMHLRIAVIEEFDRDILPAWLAMVQSSYPQCTFEIDSGSSHQSHAALYSRGVDMIVAADSSTYIDGIDEYQIMTDPYLLVASKSANHAKTIEDLVSYPFIRYSSELLLASQVEAQLRRSRTLPPQSFECSSTQAVLSLAHAFDGWAVTTVAALLGTLSADDSELSNLNAKDLPLPKFSRTISLYCRRGTLGNMPEIIARDLKIALSNIHLPKVARILPFLTGRVDILDNSDL